MPSSLWPEIGAAAAAPAIPTATQTAGGFNLVSRLFRVVTVVALVAILIHGLRTVGDTDARGVFLAGVDRDART